MTSQRSNFSGCAAVAELRDLIIDFDYLKDGKLINDWVYPQQEKRIVHSPRAVNFRMRRTSSLVSLPAPGGKTSRKPP